MQISRKTKRRERLWQHFLTFVPQTVFWSNLTRRGNYNPNLHQKEFWEYQSRGSSNLSAEQLENIKPLIDGQALKEIFINSLVMETLEYDSQGWGWINPINHTLSFPMDRLTKLAILRIKRQLQPKDANLRGFGHRIEFYLRHPISLIWKSEFARHIKRFNYHYQVFQENAESA